MSKYKSKVCHVFTGQTEKATAKIPVGTYFIKVLFKCISKYVTDHDDWEDVCIYNDAGEPKDLLQSKMYYISNDVTTTNAKTGETRTMLETSRYFMESDLGFVGNSTELETLIDNEYELITEPSENGEFERVKYINKPGGRKPIVAPALKEAFSSIFDK